MKQYYVASLCRNGVLGGGIVADDDGITFKTGKVTVSPKLRNLEMKYSNIRDFSKKWVLWRQTSIFTLITHSVTI